MCFFFAQHYHASMKEVAPVRKELGFRTVFNLLGPLTNPARPAFQLLGVYDPALLEPLARVLQQLGVRKGMVVCGIDGMDEISLCAPTRVCEFSEDTLSFYEITPEQFGFARCKKEDLTGGNPEDNARIALEVLNGVQSPRRDAVLLNAGAALYVAGLADDIPQGIEKAALSIDSGSALQSLQTMRTISQGVAA